MNLDLIPTPFQRTLVLKCNLKSDTFTYQLMPKARDLSPTKRDFLNRSTADRRSTRIYISCDSTRQIHFPRSNELTHWMARRFSVEYYECLENLVQLSTVRVNIKDTQYYRSDVTNRQ